MKEAVWRVMEGESEREVSRTTGIPKSSLARYVNEASESQKGLNAPNMEMAAMDMSLPEKKRLGRPPVLSAWEEEALASRILHGFQSKMPLSRRSLICEANALVGERKGHELRAQPQLGESWCRGFLNRHPIISLRIPEGLDADRSRNTSESVVLTHFESLRRILYDKQMFGEGRRIWNVDETGLRLGESAGSKVLAPRGTRTVWRQTTTDTRHVSVLFAVSAAGAASPPIFLLPCKRTPPRFMDGLPRADWGVMCTGSGWINGESFLAWLQSFVRYLDKEVRRDPLEDHLLIMDQHAAHCSFQVLSYAEDHHIVLYYLPPHTTHYLQPVDVSLFGPIKRQYHIAEDIFFRPHRPATLNDIPRLFMEAWTKACTPKNIISGFRGTGICPFDMDRAMRSVRLTGVSALDEGTGASGPLPIAEERNCDETGMEIEEEEDVNETNDDENVYSSTAPEDTGTDHDATTRRTHTGTKKTPFCGVITLRDYMEAQKEKIRIAEEKQQAAKEKKQRSEKKRQEAEERKQIQQRYKHAVRSFKRGDMKIKIRISKP